MWAGIWHRRRHVSLQGCCKVVAGRYEGTWIHGYLGTLRCSLGPDHGRVRNMQCEAKMSHHWPRGCLSRRDKAKYGCLIHHLQAAVKLGTGICLGLVEAAPPTLLSCQSRAGPCPVSVRATASRRADTQQGPLVLALGRRIIRHPICKAGRPGPCSAWPPQNRAARYRRDCLGRTSPPRA